MPIAPSFATARHGRQRLAAGDRLERHSHGQGYIALVISGAYHEAGTAGRRDLRAGDVLVHAPFDSHFNTIAADGAEVLNLPLPASVFQSSSGCISDVDEIVRRAEKDVEGAAGDLLETLVPAPSAAEDWPDLLAVALAHDAGLRIGDWARRMNLQPETVSRGFRKAFGVSPARFRLENRSRRAWAAIVRARRPLADIAYAEGFADQAHMARAVRHLTGQTASWWRTAGSSLFKTTRHQLANLPPS